jgi:hypothetical protein
MLYFKLTQVKRQILFMMEYHINNIKMHMILIYLIILIFKTVINKHHIGLEDSVSHVQAINHILILIIRHAKIVVMELFIMLKVDNVKITKVNM